jgi:magnesium transporter
MNDTNGLTAEVKAVLGQAAAHPSAVAERLRTLHPVEAIEALNQLEPRVTAGVIEHLPSAARTNLFNTPGLANSSAVMALLSHGCAGELLSHVNADRRAEIFRHIDKDRQEALREHLDPATRASIDRIMAYPADSAGGIMTTEFVSIPADWTVEQALAHIKDVGGARETVYALYLLHPSDKTLQQVISLRQLVIADRKATVLSIANNRTPITVTPETDREEVARLISRYDLLAVPVVDQNRLLLGIVTVDDVIDAIVAEGTEDAQKMGGMEALDGPYMQIGFMEMLRKRGGWLAALFVSEMLTATAMQHYQVQLEKAVVLTLFIPLIMSSGGNSGSQATSLIIRALALRQVKLGDWWKVAVRELPTGLVLGAFLGLIGLVRIVAWQKFGLYDYGPHWLPLAFAVALTLVGIVTFGSLAGSMLPFLLKRLGFDPASASAPFVATLVDVSGLVIYFTIAYMILKGTLL